MSHSWFNIDQQTLINKQSHTTNWMSLRSLLRKTMNDVRRTCGATAPSAPPEEQKKTKKIKTPAGKAKVIRVFPTSEQKITLNKWFGVSRWIYNKCVDAANKKSHEISQKEFRSLIINDDNHRETDRWLLDYHYDLKDEAMRTFLHNRITNFAKKTHFTLGFKSKHERFSISVLAKHWNRKRNWFKDIFDPKKLKSSEHLPNKLEHACRLVKTELNQYYLVIPDAPSQCQRSDR
jgi:hypothetical protein